MTIRSYGYDGTVGEAEAARRARFQGSVYEVGGQADLQVTADPGVTRGYQVAAGSAFAGDVLVESDAIERGALAEVTSGSRWDLLVLRRNWQPATGVSNIVVIPGGSTPMLPAARQGAVGVVDDQPLALVRVTAGQPQIQQVIDLRALAGKTYAVADLMALPSAPLGVEAVIGDETYRRAVDAQGNPAWVNITPVPPVPPKLGRVALRTNGNGDCTHVFPAAFPTSLVTVVATDATGSLGAITVKWLAEPFSDRTKASFRMFASDGSRLANANVAVTYIAYGS